jgi:hypothetical protein
MHKQCNRACTRCYRGFASTFFRGDEQIVLTQNCLQRKWYVFFKVDTPFEGVARPLINRNLHLGKDHEICIFYADVLLESRKLYNEPNFQGNEYINDWERYFKPHLPSNSSEFGMRVVIYWHL